MQYLSYYKTFCVGLRKHFVSIICNAVFLAVSFLITKHLFRSEDRLYEALPKFSENLNKWHKPLALQSCTARCFLLYFSTVSQPTCVFISAHASEFWLFSLHRFCVCVLISKWRTLRSKGYALNFASDSTKLQLKPTEC